MSEGEIFEINNENKRKKRFNIKLKNTKHLLNLVYCSPFFCYRIPIPMSYKYISYFLLESCDIMNYTNCASNRLLRKAITFVIKKGERSKE